MFGKSLLVVKDYDPRKTLSEYGFQLIPIWMRVFSLPLGEMNRDTGEAIGAAVGDFMEVEVGDDGLALGQFLWIKVCIDIKKPMMCGITLNLGEERESLWCRVIGVVC